MDQKFNINYALQLTSDKIDSSSLENGKFTSRNYYKIAILPEYLIDQGSAESLSKSWWFMG